MDYGLCSGHGLLKGYLEFYRDKKVDKRSTIGSARDCSVRSKKSPGTQVRFTNNIHHRPHVSYESQIIIVISRRRTLRTRYIYKCVIILY